MTGQSKELLFEGANKLLTKIKSAAPIAESGVCRYVSQWLASHASSISIKAAP